jgi:hypothetical protein
MKLTPTNQEKNAEEALRSCLGKVPFITIASIEQAPVLGKIVADFLVKLGLPGGEQSLVVEVKSNGQPRLAREAVNLLLRYRNVNIGIYGVFMAPYISPRSADICSKEGIGYIDLAGNCRLCFRQVYIEQQGRPNPFAKRRDLRSLYSPKAARVLRVLLAASQKTWKIKDLAKEADVSLGQASNVKKLMGDREWICTGPDGVALNKPEQLLAEWAENYTYRKNPVREFYSLKSITEIEAEIAQVCRQKDLKYALTGFSGAARLAPTVRYQRVTAYVEETEEDLASLLNLKEVPSGANVSLLTPYDEGVFYGVREIEGIRIACPVQIYLDLLGFRGRGEEAANVVLKRVIQPQW